jgi:hypothetical protein
MLSAARMPCGTSVDPVAYERFVSQGEPYSLATCAGLYRKMIKTMRRIRTAVTVLLFLGTVSFCSAEIYHRLKFGHFASYGAHTDVILGNSDIASDDMYYAHLYNFSVLPLEIDGCIAVHTDGSAVVDYRWDVQKWDSSRSQWASLRGANTWVPKAFGGYWTADKCHRVPTIVLPFTSKKVAWVYKDWVTTGEPVRIALHTSVTSPPESQRIIYTKTFIVTAARSLTN